MSVSNRSYLPDEDVYRLAGFVSRKMNLFDDTYVDITNFDGDLACYGVASDISESIRKYDWKKYFGCHYLIQIGISPHITEGLTNLVKGVPYGGACSPLIEYRDWREVLVGVLAHESFHVHCFRNQVKETEAECEWYAQDVLEDYRCWNKTQGSVVIQ